ncbi:preprotein translocase subunit YajC [Granulicatella seriolae]|uniref:Preprotein translocase subunit YajC n=1 Tax=Granulicatella seriolae TaxID=2967226 RepID=A0ABT1WMS1_9LACT|nr:preprotein translocase subunit YajC [Granulicatella seriolae]
MNWQIVIILYIAMGLVYFFVVRKQKARNREAQDLLNTLKPGDHVVTVGGLHGIVDEIIASNNTIVLDCEGIFLTFERRSIHHVVPPVASDLSPTEDQPLEDMSVDVEEKESDSAN